jgi:hypothetical protein
VGRGRTPGLTNEIDPEEGSALLALLGAMAAMFVAALAVPGTFTSDGVLFGIASSTGPPRSRSGSPR